MNVIGKEKRNLLFELLSHYIGKARLFSTADDEVNVSEGLFLWVVGDINMLDVYELRLIRNITEFV